MLMKMMLRTAEPWRGWVTLLEASPVLFSLLPKKSSEAVLVLAWMFVLSSATECSSNGFSGS